MVYLYMVYFTALLIGNALNVAYIVINLTFMETFYENNSNNLFWSLFTVLTANEDVLVCSDIY